MNQPNIPTTGEEQGLFLDVESPQGLSGLTHVRDIIYVYLTVSHAWTEA